MSGYEKQDWTNQYAAPQGQGGYQQQPPPQQTQQAWNQQPYGQQQGGYQAPSSYSAPPGYGAPPQGPYGSPQPQQGYGAPPQSQGQYGAPPQQQWSGAPSPPLGPPGGPAARHSVSFKFSGTKQTILNSQVMDPQGRVPFKVVSDKKHTTVSTSDGTTLAVMDWNHSSPVMHYNGNKLACKDWIKLDKKKKCVLHYYRSPARPRADTLAPFPFCAICRIRVFNHAGREYHWITRDETVYVRITHQSPIRTSADMCAT